MFSPDNISALKTNLSSLSAVIDDFGREMAGSGRVLNAVEQYYNTHLKRVRAHLEGVIQLLDSYSMDPTLILPIAHIIRSLLTDFITAFYLITFYDKNEINHASFSNELRLLDRDAYKAILEWMEAEEDLHKFNENLPPISKGRIEERKEGFRKYFSEILDINQKPKKTKEIREGSDPKLFGHIQKLEDPPNTLSEKCKIKRLKQIKYFKMLDGYMLYKYFSQFYHESKLFRHLASEDVASENFNYLKWAFIPVYHMTDTSLLLFMRGENIFSNRLMELKEELEKIGND